VDLCGHATLASAHILGSRVRPPETKSAFTTRSGILRPFRHGDDIELDFPLSLKKKRMLLLGLLEALATSARYVGKNQFDYLVEVESEAALRGLAPTSSAWRRCRCEGSLLPEVRRFHGSISFPAFSPQVQALTKTA